MKRRVVAWFLSCATSVGYAGEWSGSVTGEFRWFPEQTLYAGQHSSALSLAFQPEYHHRWDDDQQSFTITPFFRVDEHDSERTHADLRELTWLYARSSVEWRVGVRKVFWGVTESQHLVDIINQTDGVENVDGEDKLGQPMINVALIGGARGTLDLFVLPYFREQTFSSVEGRPSLRPPVAVDEPVYASADKNKHVDYAARWRWSGGVWDLGLTYFTGTGRDPRLVPRIDGDGNPYLQPHYDLIHQLGLDVQATVESWLWKLEAIRRSGQGKPYSAATAGVEYTIYGVGESAADLGILAEYLADSRHESAPTPFEGDVFLGFRLALNDERSSEALFGMIVDSTGDGQIYRLEWSQRLGAHWKFEFQGFRYANITAGDALYAQRRDGYQQFQLGYYF